MALDDRWNPHVPPTTSEPRPRERLWTLTKAGKRIDAELLFHDDAAVETQFSTKA